MKKNLLSGLLAASLLSGTATAQSEMCQPKVDYQSYACISKVEMNGVVSETPEGVSGETMFSEDYTQDESRLFKAEAGQTYTLKVTFSNFDSGFTDLYQMTAFFDWNNDKVFQENERCTDQLFRAGRKGGLIDNTFEVKVPADVAIGKVHMRVLVFYFEVSYPIDPCDRFESGNQEDYLIELRQEGDDTGIDKPETAKVSVYPNPATHTVRVDATVSEYELYSANGQLISRGQPANQTIDISDNAPGLYLLKMKTAEGGTKTTRLTIQ